MPERRGRVRFGVFEVDLVAGELRRSGTRVKLQEQPFQVLAALLERPGEIVTKDELQQRIWKDDTFVDFDRSLATAINKVRQALGDSATRPRFIETVPKRGYRFVTSAVAGASGGTDRAAAALASKALRSKRRWAWVLGAVAVVAIVALVVISQRNKAIRDAPPAVPVPLTSLPGQERYPAISPDGTQVAFSWNGEDGDNFDIFVKLIGTGEPVRLTTDSADDLDPVWSPDGRHLVFARSPADTAFGCDPQTTEPCRVLLVRVPALGGQEVPITDIDRLDRPLTRAFNHYLCWDRKRESLIFGDRNSPNEPFSLFSYSLASGLRTRLTSPPDGLLGDVSPSLSPDGRRLTFVRYQETFSGDVHILNLSPDGLPEEPPRQITSTAYDLVSAPVFTNDGREVVFSQGSAEPHLWRVGVSGQETPRRLAGQGERGILPSFSRDGKMAYSQFFGEFDIWRLELSAPGIAAGPPLQWIYTTQSEIHPDYSPDGSKIAFQSNRSGTYQVWVSEADGSSAEQLTFLDADSPPNRYAISRDGRFLLFTLAQDVNSDLMLVESFR